MVKLKVKGQGPVSFELEFLRLDKDGKATVVDREQCPLDLSLAKMKARQRFDERRGRGEELDAVRIVDASGLEVLVYREGGDPP
jgi:hypothetical protein